MRIAAVDLFCGIGGLTYGIQKSGIDVIAGIDIDSTCKYAYETNNSSEFINKGVEELSVAEIEQLYPEDSIKVLMGCAPCQPFSNYSLRYNKDGVKKNDKWKLLYYFGDLITSIKPEIISMENVPQLANETVFRDFVDKLENAGYFVDWNVVNCAHYKVPQNRKRLVLLASLLGSIKMKVRELTDDQLITVKDSIKFLPSLTDGDVDESDLMHKASRLSSDNRKRIRQSVPGGT